MSLDRAQNNGIEMEWSREIKTTHRYEKGFTLGELLVVIAIMTILVGVAVGSFTGLIGSGKSEAAIYEKEAVQTAIDSYMGVSASATITARNDAAVITSSDSDTPFVTYLRRLPTTYQYTWTETGSVTQNGAPAGGSGESGSPSGSNIVAQWHLDESSGASAADSSGSNHGTIVGADHTTGISNRALDFDGNNDYVTVPSDSSLDPGSTYSISAWIKSEDVTQQWKCILERGTTGSRYFVWLNYDEVVVGHKESPYTATTDANLQSDTWHHVVFTFDNDASPKANIYVDGVSKTVANQPTSTMPSIAGILNIGMATSQSNSAYYFDGQIDEVTIYNEARSAAEILSEYNSTKDDLLAMWHLDEKTDTIASDSIGGYNSNITGAGWTTGVCGSALSLDGNDFAEISGFPNLQTDFTITAWIYTTDNSESGQRIFVDDENNSGGYALSLGDPGSGALRFYSRGMNSVILDTPGGVIQNDQWYLVTAVADITNQSRYIYVNGVERASDETDTGTWGTDSGDASIGGETASGETQNRFEGVIDDVRIYGKALEQTEIEALYDALDPS